MNKRMITKTAISLALLLTLTACGNKKEDNRTVIKEPGKTITIIENDSKDIVESNISVERIDKYEGVEISDWFDEDNVIVSKENQELKKMDLEELSQYYPRNLYLYNLNTKEYKLVKKQENLFLGGAIFSKDKKHLLYYKYSLGDPSHFVMNMDTSKEFMISGENIGGAYTANWDDNENVMGASFAGGAYVANTSGKISVIEELRGESFFLVEKIQDKIFYVINNTPSSELWVLNLSTKEKKNLNIKNVDGITPSPDRKQMLVFQGSDSKRSMILCDAEGNNIKTIAEGTEVVGASWSPDQSKIAYSLKSASNGSTSNGIYVYDMVTGKSTQIAVNVVNAGSSWSPSGKKIAFTEALGEKYNSSIIHLK